jgi:hypothetical protein
MMIDTQPERNPNTHRVHRREVFWQITFPLILGLLLILGLAVWTIVAATNGGNVSQPADASLIFLILPTMVMAIIPLALFAGLAYAVIMLNTIIPPYMRQAQDAMIRVRDGVRTGADKLVEPVIRFKTVIASLEILKRK